MKNLIKTNMVCALLFLCATPYLMNSQVSAVSCPFYIQNNRSCDITVHYEVSDCNPNTCGGTGVGITASNPSLVIAPGGVVFVSGCVTNPFPGYPTAPGCGAGGDVFVWLKEIDYVDITNGGSNAYSVSGGNCLVAGFTGVGATAIGPILASYGVSPACMGSGTYTVVWNSGGVDIW